MQVIGPYRLLSLISTGKATQIWEVIRDSTGQRYALKKLQESNAGRTDAALLKNEYQVLRKLEHPNVIRVFDFGTHQGMPYLVLELFRVPSMKQLVRQGLETYEDRLERMVRESVGAVAYLAEQGLVHQDIKPDNFLIGPEGEVKLIDFALARPRAGALERLLPRKRNIQGTPSYIAPEQLRNRPVDLPADVYSLGCTLYELVAGRTPFTGASVNELLNRHLKQSPPNPQTACRRLEPEFARLIQQMLAKDPQKRPTMAEVQRRLETIPKLLRPAPTGA